MNEQTQQKPVTISVCAIVKNEAHNIGRFLTDAIRLGDEVVIADTGSSDNTVALIREFAATYPQVKIYEYVSEGTFHFGKARNFVFDHASMDYAIMMDADERPSEAFFAKFRDFYTKHQPAVGSLTRRDLYLPHLSSTYASCIRCDTGIRYGTGPTSQVHEQLEHHETVTFFPETLWHDQGLNHYIIRPQRIFVQLEVEIDRVPRTKSFVGHVLRGIWYFWFRFKKIYFTRELYKDGALGFKYAFMRSLDAFLIQLFVGLKPRQETFDSLLKKSEEYRGC